MYKNLTPQDFTIIGADGLVKEVVPPEPESTRIEYEETDSRNNGGIMIRTVSPSHIVNLPDYKPGVRLIVPAVVAHTLAGERDDLYFGAKPVRDEEGKVIGSQGLMRVI